MPIEKNVEIEQLLRFISGKFTVNVPIATPPNGDSQQGADQALKTQGYNLLYNGNPDPAWDRWRNNITGVALTAANSSVASRTGADLVNYNHGGMYLHVEVTGTAGVPGFLPHIQAKTTNGYQALWSAAAFHTSNAERTWLFYPGASGVAPAAGLTATVNLPIPRNWRLVLEYSADGTANTLATVAYIM